MKLTTLYRNATGSATGTAASRRSNREILCLPGGSRQEIASRAHEAAVFYRGLPRRADHPVHQSPSGIDSQAESTVGTGRRRPNALDAS